MAEVGEGDLMVLSLAAGGTFFCCRRLADGPFRLNEIGNLGLKIYSALGSLLKILEILVLVCTRFA